MCWLVMCVFVCEGLEMCVCIGGVFVMGGFVCGFSNV